MGSKATRYSRIVTWGYKCGHGLRAGAKRKTEASFELEILVDRGEGMLERTSKENSGRMVQEALRPCGVILASTMTAEYHGESLKLSNYVHHIARSGSSSRRQTRYLVRGKGLVYDVIVARHRKLLSRIQLSPEGIEVSSINFSHLLIVQR